MKRNLLVFIILVLCIATLASCKNKNNNNGDGGSNTIGEAEKGLIFGEGQNAHIICNYKSSANPSDSLGWLNDLSNYILNIADYSPYVLEATGIPDGHEIVIGDTSREISAQAKELLNQKIRKVNNSLEYDLQGWDKIVGYAVYSDGNSVAVVWSDFQLEEAAIEYFAKNFILSDTLKLEAGYIKTEVFNLEAFLAERKIEVLNDQWAELKAQIPTQYADGIVKSLQALYTLYDIDMVRWLANLYDPQVVIVDSQGNPVPEYNQEGNVIYGGGWYHSNSGRDNEGFLPDIENTYVALEFVAATGMAEMFGDNWVPAMPEWLKTQVGLWFQNLQDPDTFFYHPQWPKEYINANGLQSRITRDRGSARTTLRKLGFAQLYPEVVATSNPGLPGKLNGTSSVVAASKVVATAEMLWQYQSNENFAEYLKGLEAEIAGYNDSTSRASRFYAYGNYFQSTTNMMTPEMKKMTEEFFNKYQNPETGTWDAVPSYSATNGIHKIGAVYNAIGAKLNYVDQMVESVIEIVGWTIDEKPIGSGVELYNAWSCFPYIYTNVRKHDPDGASKIQAIKDRVFASAAELIMNARDQIAGFRRPDGSYGYTRIGSCPTAQGAPVALAGYNEGDVNGNAIASLNVIEYILYALELGDYMPDMFGEYERMEFVHILNNLGPVIKHTEELGEDVLHTFEDIPDGELPPDYSTELDSGRNPIPDTFAKVTTLDDGNRVLEVAAKHRGTDDNGRNYSLRAPIYMVKNGANMAHIEFDLCVLSEGTKSGSILQFNIAGAGSPVIYPYFVINNDTVSLTTDKYVKIGDLGKLDETISFRLEYYWVEGIYRVYANGIYVGSNSTTYNNRAHQEVQGISLGAPSTSTVHYTLDNVRMLRTVKAYVDESLATSPEHTFAGEADGTPVKGFIDNGVLVVPYGGSASYAGEGETLELHGPADGAPLSVTIPTFTREGLIPNATAISLSFKVGSLLGGSMKIALLAKDGSTITGLGFSESSDGSQIVGSHYGSDLLSSFCSFYFAENLEGADEITLNVNYSHETGIMKVTIGDKEYTAIAGSVEGIGGIKIFLDGAESLVELVEAYLENTLEEIPDDIEIKVDPIYEDFEKGYTETVEEWICNNSSHTGAPEQTVTNLYFPAGAKAFFSPETGYSNTHGAVAKVLTDNVTGNSYVNIVAPKRISPRDRAHSYIINAQNCVVDPNVFVVETDIKLDSKLPDGSQSHGTYLQIMLTNEVTGKYVMFIMSSNAAKVTMSGIELADWDTWFKLRIEYYPAQGVIQLYADGAYKGELSKGYQASSSSDLSFATLGDRITKVSFGGANSTSAGFSISFDNSALYSAKGEYVGGREPEINYPDGPSYETFDKVSDTGGAGNLITGATGTTVSYTGATNEGGAQAFLRVDEAIGNSFITIYSSGRVNSKDRSHGVNVPIVVLSGDANMIALEADVFLDSRSVSKDFVQILFAHGKNNAYYGQLNMSLKDGAAYFGGVKVGYVDEWFTLRFEFYLDVGKLKVYNGDTYLGDIEKFSQANSSNADKLVSELKEISTVALNTMNNSGLFYLGVDNVAAYTIAKEYVAETAGTLPAPNPTPDNFDPNPKEDPETPPTDPDDPTDPVIPDTPVGDDDVDVPEDGGDIPGVTIPGDSGVKDDNTDEWTQ